VAFCVWHLRCFCAVLVVKLCLRGYTSSAIFCFFKKVKLLCASFVGCFVRANIVAFLIK
jgi:hypothetical protein